MSGYDFEAANEAALFFGLGDWYFMSSDDREKLHNEKLGMPSYGQQSKEARDRNIARIKNRNKLLKAKNE
jgi:hypothetical protein